MPLNEADTRAKLIDPALYVRGWTEAHIKRELAAGMVEVVDGQPRRKGRGRVDYTLRVATDPHSQPVALALIEAKAEDKAAALGLEQAKGYSRRLHVPFVFSSNGHLFVEYDRFTGLTTTPRPLADFPTPTEMRTRYERGMGFGLDSDAAKPLRTRYATGESSRRYYQDAAIRAVLEKLARGEKRALLTLATGAGKTFIAVNLLKRIADAGQLRRALFICDRDELRTQGLAAFSNTFGADAAAVFQKPDGSNNARNARIHVATYQTLDIAGDDSDASFLVRHYPENHFSHIVIDECHRSAWGKWSEVLKRNPDAVQIGLTATPRELPKGTDAADAQVSADNLSHFGEPAYEYGIGQGIEDGYLAACEILRRDIFIERKGQSERETGVLRKELADKKLTDAATGVSVEYRDLAKDHYDAGAFEARLLLPERVTAMCKDLFEHLIETGAPEQKTIVFCARDAHADAVATEMNNRYVRWCEEQNRPHAETYAFKCTAASGGNEQLADLRGAARHHFIATTVDLLSTGVDVPALRNVVFFKYVRSPIAFHQMVGRGTRIDEPSGKLMFRVYDYTDATRLFGADFLMRAVKPARKDKPPGPPRPPEPIVVVEGIHVRVSDAGRLILTQIDGRAVPVTVEEYKERLAEKLVRAAPTLDIFRRAWIAPGERRELIRELPEEGRSAFLVRTLEDMNDYDLYDVLADLGYGLAPHTRVQRSEAFHYKHRGWLDGLPPPAANTLRALAGQFARNGTEELENPRVFRTPAVERAGGLRALAVIGKPAEVLRETKMRIFAA
jgi:type I restriction enzyme R subunit